MGLVFCFGALCSAAVLLVRMLELPSLDDYTVEPLEAPPRVSVIVAACNEASTIEPALRRLLQDEDSSREVIVVEDRSTDDTRAILRRLASEFGDQLQLVCIDELPPGWLGKVHALHRGSQEAQGDWLLFSDADVHIDGALLRRAVALCERRGLDHLALLPKLSTTTFLARIVIAAFVGIFAMSSSRRRRQNPQDRDHGLGVGAFNLCRRSVFERSEGFKWLRMEVADDLALGLAMKRAGAQHECMIARTGLEVEWYPDLPSMFRGLEKNSFGAVGHYSFLRAIVFVLGLIIACAGPLLCVGAYPMATGIAYLALAWVGILGARHLNWDRSPFLFAPLGIFIIALILLNSTAQAWRRGHVTWRGTSYDLDALKKNQIFRL